MISQNKLQLILAASNMTVESNNTTNDCYSDNDITLNISWSENIKLQNNISSKCRVYLVNANCPGVPHYRNLTFEKLRF